MTAAPSVLDIEEPLRNLRAGIHAVHLIADSIVETDSEEKAALDWIAYKMADEHAALKGWFDSTCEASNAAKGSGPVAVT